MGGADRAVEAELTEHRHARKALTGQLAGGREQGAGEGEVEAGAGLAQVTRSEVGRDPSRRPVEA